LNIRANTAPDKVGSVVFILDGQKVRTENGVPYALAGDSPSGDYHAWSLPLGDHTLTAIPYSKYNGIGREGGSLTIHFTVVYEPNIIYLKPFRITDQMKLTAPEEEMQFTLYPNPVKDFLTVSLKGPQLNKMKTISILTISGATIKTIHPVTQNKTIQLNVSSMVPGTYILKIINDHKVNYKKFVKL
jgi:hypothetical protein